MKLCYKHSDVSHFISLGHPHHSIVCGIVKKLEQGWWEWQVRHRRGVFDIKNSCYRPSLIRYGYAINRETAIRNVIDFIKNGEWDA